MNNTKKIVILGAGYGGVHAAKKLSKKYKKNDNIEITLIDRNPFHTLMTELHEVAGGRVDPDSVQVDLQKIFRKSKVQVVVDDVKSIDMDNQKLKSEYDEYEYDYLILGTGSEPSFFGIPGVKEHGFSLWSFEDALKIREHIEDCFKKASVERNVNKRKKLLTFAVAGAGFTGIEMIGELLEWKHKLCREYNVDLNEVRLLVVEAMDKILSMLDGKMADKAENYMRRKGVEVLKNSPIVEVTPDNVKLKDGTEIPTNTLIWTCGVQGCSFGATLGLETDRRSRLKTNEFMQSLDKENVYIVGDSVCYQEDGKPTPQIVEAALQTAETAVHNLVADIEKTEKKAFKSNYHGFMVSIGGRYGVANLQGTKMSGFFALVMKHLVNMHYLFGIGGFPLIFTYLNHEFFGIREGRSIMGNHLSGKANRLWLVPLRLYIGVLWLLEGINKVKDGWLSPDNIYIVQTAGVSGASEQAADAANTAAQQVVPLLSQPPAIFSWFMDTFVAPFAHYFQVMVVLAEIGIGLALIAGLFTFLASLASIFLCINFILSAMAGVEILWYAFGAIALMGGAGRVFGLDYYVMPWIFKFLSNFWYGKRTPVYVNKAK